MRIFFTVTVTVAVAVAVAFTVTVTVTVTRICYEGPGQIKGRYHPACVTPATHTAHTEAHPG